MHRQNGYERKIGIFFLLEMQCEKLSLFKYIQSVKVKYLYNCVGLNS